jgi:hypothetical protein
MHTFATPTRPRLTIAIPRGRISVTAADTQETTVALSARHGDAGALDWIAQAEVAQIGDEIVVRGPTISWTLFGGVGPIDAVIRTPQGADAALRIGAGGIETDGRLGHVIANSGAGAVRVSDCDDADVKSGAGEIEVGAVAGSVEATTGAGRVKLGRVGGDARVKTGMGSVSLTGAAGEARFTTGRGSIRVGEVGVAVDAHTASGDIDVGRAAHGSVRARTVSGRVTVGVPRGVAALLDISTVHGRVSSDLQSGGPPAEGEARVQLTLSTVSGTVTVAHVEPEPAHA